MEALTGARPCASSGLQPHRSTLAMTAPPHHKPREEPRQAVLTQGAGAATGAGPRHAQARGLGTRIWCGQCPTAPGHLVWPRGQQPEVPQCPPQSGCPVAWSPPWHSWPPLLPQLLLRSIPHMVHSLWTPQLFLRESLAPTALLPGQQLC